MGRIEACNRFSLSSNLCDRASISDVVPECEEEGRLDPEIMDVDGAAASDGTGGGRADTDTEEEGFIWPAVAELLRLCFRRCALISSRRFVS